MKLTYTSLILLATLLLSTTAFGRKRARDKEQEKKPPVVAVANLKVESTNESVQKKIAELTDKVRDAVASSTTTCQVINTREMKKLMKKHGKAMSTCYDDCDVEFGLLIGADFVIGGNLAPTADSVVTTLEIRDTRTRNVISSKKIEGNNYFVLESSLLSAIRRFVKPLNNIVYQATDDEVVADKPVPQPAPQSESGDVFGGQPEGQTAEAGQTGDTAQTGNTGHPAGTVTPASEYLAKPTAPTSTVPLSPLGRKWQEKKEEPPLLKEEDLGFKKAQMGVFGLGITAGYPLNVSRAKKLRDLYVPIFHVGVELLARIHHLLDVGIIMDLDYLNGRQAADSRFGAPGLGNCTYPDDFDEANLRKCAGADASTLFTYVSDYNPVEDDLSESTKWGIFQRRNYYRTGSYWTVGVRPTIRLVLPIGIAELLLGAGIGINYMKTSGYWETWATARQFIPQTGGESTPVSEHLVYSVAVSDIGFYGVFEFALTFRVLDRRLGFGPYVSYKLPAISKKGVDTSVQVTNLQGSDSLVNGEVSAFGPTTNLAARQKDIQNSPFGHTEMMNLLTLGLTADWRF
jgi:hypothetical protein